MDTFIGSIMLFPYDFVPTGWELCKGQKLQNQEYQALHALLAHRFGDGGPHHFLLPDLRDKAPAPHLHYCICVEGVFPPRG